MATISTVLGATVILATLRDIFHELFHPGGRGSLSRAVMRFSWRVLRRISAYFPPLLNVAGPGIMVLIIGMWGALISVGWALVVWPHMPDAFLLSTGLDPAETSGFLDALYLSTTTLSTLGYGDITPQSNALRVLLPLEALVGFGLLTVSISWVLSVYPVLSRRRSLAQRVLFLNGAEEETGAPLTHSDAQTLASLASELNAVRNDLIQFPITYYFHRDENDTLSAAMPHLLRLSESHDHATPGARLHAAILRRSIEAFADTLSDLFLDLPYPTPEEAIEAYAADHLHPRRREAEANGAGLQK